MLAERACESALAYRASPAHKPNEVTEPADRGADMSMCGRVRVRVRVSAGFVHLVHLVLLLIDNLGINNITILAAINLLTYNEQQSNDLF